MFNMIKTAFQKAKSGVKKGALAVAGALGLSVGATPSQAAVTFDGLTQSFSGTFDLTAYYSAITIIIVAISVVAAIRLAVRQFKGV